MDFKWYMNTVAWDLPKYYPPVEPPPAAWGEVGEQCHYKFVKIPGLSEMQIFFFTILIF